MFLSLKETYDAGEESREWEKLVEDYNKLRYAELDEEYFAPWTPLQVLDDLARRYKVWELEETPLWKRTVEKLGLEGSVQRDANVLHVRAKLPHIGAQEGLLRKLLYSIHGGVEKPAAVLWEDESEGAFQRVTMVLCPELKVALEISFRKRRPTVRRHRVIGGSVGNGVHLTESRFLTYVWRQGTAYPMDADQAVLFGCAANLVPELPVAPNLINHGHTRPMKRSY